MPLDPDEGTASPALDAILRGPAAALTAVVLLAGERARASGWAARAAVALARRWPGPRRVVLIDLDVANPTLHRLGGVANEAGIFDVLEFGASLHRVAVPSADGRFHLVATGPLAAAGDDATLGANAWARILHDAAARRETLLLFVPAESAASGALVQRAGTVLVLADAAETNAIVERLPRRYGVLAVLAPPDGETADMAIVAAAAASNGAARATLASSAVDRAALAAELRRRQRAARLTRRPGGATAVAPAEPEPGVAAVAESADTGTATAPAGIAAAPGAVVAGTGDVALEARVETAPDEIALETLPPAQAPPRPRRRYAQPISLTLFIVLVVSIIAGSLHFLTGRLRRPAPAVPPRPPADSPAARITSPAPPPDAVAYSVALEAHQNVATALERVDALTAAQADLSFYVAPLERDGVVRYHLMAGPVTDSAAALALRDTLRARGVKTTSTPTDIRYTPLALLIGDYTARGDAEQQIAELRRLDIPAYLVVGVAADSVPLFRVFVGGFSGPAEADVARQLLRAAGVRDHLVNRTRSSTR